ncbi:carbohydrate ABC transporter permease [Paenibacillaceae bacterium WGS1546]|uniref:carbohydrate ABC transporter permease n=1 Tax=Cohnella sp. WGS1546 TaxID=3366810 RepID=UPI00372D554A
MKSEAFIGWMFILPAIAGLAVFMIIPMILSFIISFTDWNYLDGIEGIRIAGFGNYVSMWRDEWFIDSLKNNFIFALVTVPATMVFSLLCAIVLNKGVFLKKSIRLMLFVPYISSMVAVSIVWSNLFNPTQGPINQFLRGLGVDNPPGWLSSMEWALPAIIIMTIWYNVGYNMIIYLAGLQNIPKDLYEAVRIDGAGPFKSFMNVTLPLLSPTTFFVMITCIINSFQVFIAVFIMTQGGPGTSTTVLTYYAYKAGFGFYKMGYASAMAWILFLIILIITVLQWKGQKRWVHYT